LQTCVILLSKSRATFSRFMVEGLIERIGLAVRGRALE
jgi:hypothetical protein